MTARSAANWAAIPVGARKYIVLRTVIEPGELPAQRLRTATSSDAGNGPARCASASR